MSGSGTGDLPCISNFITPNAGAFCSRQLPGIACGHEGADPGSLPWLPVYQSFPRQIAKRHFYYPHAGNQLTYIVKNEDIHLKRPGFFPGT
jgi:hypothetical protein